MKEYELSFQKLVAKVDILELKISNALVKKKLQEKPEDLEEITETVKSPDGLDSLRELAKNG